MKTNTLKLACAALLTLSVTAISTSASAEVSNDGYPSRLAGYYYSRQTDELDYDGYPSRLAGYYYSRQTDELDYDGYPSRLAGYYYSRQK
ncbi:hypothetical protein ACVRWQ_06255 [Streptococcus phocae subsp. salmonis]|uniref:hypothetical protein n=1 Tax=Streptococcus phocae TaxID=119224 RepID=UPI000531E07F|nr:hypothetical protein [Streptococcus phocae]KGR72249.1 hypothetical protein NX86_07265 [Streptococcus phocae subsp. salmonis]